jgi:hypothetical protein
MPVILLRIGIIPVWPFTICELTCDAKLYFCISIKKLKQTKMILHADYNIAYGANLRCRTVLLYLYQEVETDENDST